MDKILWYLAIGSIVVLVDLMVEKLRGSQAYRNLIQSIEEQGDQRSFFIMGFLIFLVMFWPIDLAAMLLDYIMAIKRRL